MPDTRGPDIARLEEEWQDCLDLLGQFLRGLPESDAQLWVALDLLERGVRLRRKVSIPDFERAGRLADAASILLLARRPDGIRRYILPDRIEQRIRAVYDQALCASRDEDRTD